MVWQFSPYAVLLVVSTGLSGLLAYYAWRRQSLFGSIYLCVLLLLTSFWSAANALELFSAGLEQKIFWAKVQYFPILNLSPVWLLFALNYSNQSRFILAKRHLLLWFVPAVTYALVLTNDLHRLIWSAIEPVSTDYGIFAVYQPGTWATVSTIYSYSLVVLSIALLFGSALRSSPLHRWQSLALLFCALIPFSSNVLYLFGIGPLPGVDLTPFTFTITSLLLLIGISRLRLLDTVPVAYDLLFEHAAQGILVLDAGKRLVDINPAARKCLSLDTGMLGQAVENVFSGRRELQALFEEQQEVEREISTRVGDSVFWLNVYLRPLRDRRQRIRGWLFTCKDISEQKEAQQRARADAEYIRLLNEITLAALRAPNLKSMLQTLADRMVELIQADGCYISLWDEHRQMAVPAAASGPLREVFREQLIPHGERTFTQSVLDTGKTLLAEDVLHSPYISPEVAACFPTRSIIGIPAKSATRCLGAVILGFNHAHVFTALEIKRCEQAALQVSLAIMKMNILEEAGRRADQLAMLNRIGMVITSGLDTENVILSVFEQCRQIIPMDTFFLALYDAESGEISFPIFYDEGGYRVQEPHQIDHNPGMVGYVIKKKETVLISDSLKEAKTVPFKLMRRDGSPTRSLIGVPLTLEGRVLGVISVQNYEPNAYTNDHLCLLETMAAQSAVALENARLYSEVKLLAKIDELTGLYNYRSLLELGPREVERARRFERPLSALFYDIDKFRDFNNRYNHATGNLVLAGVAECVRNNLRAVDMVFRYGGEEFVALLPESSLQTAIHVAERLREEVEKLGIQSEWGELKVTISVGVAELTPEMADLDDLLACADWAEQRAKKLGRNRVEAAGDMISR